VAEGIDGRGSVWREPTLAATSSRSLILGYQIFIAVLTHSIWEPKMNELERRVFLVLLTLCLVSVIAILPYVLTNQGEVLALIPIPLELLLPLQILANGVQFAVFIFLGLRFSEKVGLRIPILENILSSEGENRDLGGPLLISLLSGVVAGLVIFVFDVLLAHTLSNIELLKPYPGQDTPPLWQTILALPYGAIAEEVAMRLCVMSVFAWVFSRIKSDDDGHPTAVGMWLSVVIAAVLFGVSHLPTVLFFADLSVLHILRIVFLNAIGGTVFGFMFWRRGLEYAMMSHLGMDIVLHILLPPFL
jgi:hypothetical protein